MRKGTVALFVVIVTAISLLLTASYSISTKNKTSSKAHAQSLPVEVLCGLTGQPCCTGNNVPLCEPTLSCSTQNVCLSNVNDPQYINQSCTVPDGRSGTCQWAVGEVTCTGNNELISGACPGSSDVRCCVAKATAPPASNPPPAAGGASCAGGVLCNNQPVTGTDGQTVCGLSNLSYTCNNGTWAATGQSCSCPNAAPPPATNPPPVSSASQPPETACLKPLLRYVRPDNITHFYTANWSELGGGTAMWQYEGVMGYVESASSPGCYSASTQGFYRFIKTGTDLHFYQINNPTPPDATWASEGLVGYINAIDDSSKFTTILDRFYNAVTQDHFYTNNAAESSNLKANGQGYVFEFPAGWTFGSEALTASANTPPAANPPASNPPVSSGPVTNTPPQTPGNPVTSTGSGAPGYQNYTRYSLDCTSGISV
ncbi:hypothetical protein HYS00_00375, partial [Candidatus Microgenomates bacterium]|nr:hypothetical protein [Candidatus Microgenomates bacterium]